MLVGERWNNESARKAYEAIGGKPAFTSAHVDESVAEALQNHEPTKSPKLANLDD